MFQIRTNDSSTYAAGGSDAQYWTIVVELVMNSVKN